MARWKSLVGLWLAAACGEPPVAPTPVVTAFSVSPAQGSFLPGEDVQLVATALDQFGRRMTGTVVAWAALDGAVAGVNATGLVTAATPGTARVVATLQGHADTAVLTVLVPVASVILSVDSIEVDTVEVEVAWAAHLVATPFAADGAPLPGRVMTWTTRDSLVARVIYTGLVIGRGPGTTRVVATVEGKADSVLIVVPRPVAAVTATPDSAVVLVGDSIQLTAQAFDAGGFPMADRPPRWTSSDTLKARVDSAGLVRVGPRVGTVYVTARSGFRSDAVGVRSAIRFTSITVGSRHQCGLTAAGQAYCLGENALGQLGDGTQTRRTVPTPVVGGLTFAQLDAGNDFTCGVTVVNEAYCWGAGGALGTPWPETCASYYGGTWPCSTIPRRAAADLSLAAISAGGTHTCGLTAAGEAYCWGGNSAGQLGNGLFELYGFATVPQPTVGPTRFKQISAGDTHTCAIALDDHVYCWGYNARGMVGDSTTVNRSSPTLVFGGLTARSVQTGFSATCAVTAGDVGYCWGQNFGSTPQAIPGGIALRDLGSSGLSTCGLSTAGAVYCWNGAPQVFSPGLALTSLVVGLPTPYQFFTFCGQRPDGLVACWINQYYQPALISGQP